MDLEYILHYWFGDKTKSVSCGRYRMENIVEFMKETWNIMPYHTEIKEVIPQEIEGGKSEK